MAFYDWNGDGKNDFSDDYIEYQIYKKSTSDNSYVPRGRNGISTFGAIVATIGGLLLAAGIMALFGGGENTSVLLTIILWILCGTGLSIWFDNIGF